MLAMRRAVDDSPSPRTRPASPLRLAPRDEARRLKVLAESLERDAARGPRQVVHDRRSNHHTRVEAADPWRQGDIARWIREWKRARKRREREGSQERRAGR